MTAARRAKSSSTPGGLQARLRVGHSRGRILALVALVIAVLGLATWLFVARGTQAQRLGALEAENAALLTQAEQGRLELEIEKAARARMELELIELQAKLKQFETELEFIRSRSAPKR